MRAVSVRSVSSAQVRRSVVQSARVPFAATPRASSAGGVSVAAHDALERSTLESGVRVLTVDAATATTSVTLLVQAGTRYEDRQTRGASSFLKHLAYKGSADKSALRLVRDLEHVGANMRVTVDREHIAYQITGLRPHSGQDIGLAVMAETLRAVTQPTLLEYEVEQVRPLVVHDAEARAHNGALTLRDRVHAEHFADSGLARAPQASVESAAQRTPQQLHRFVAEQFTAPRLSVVGVGIEHATLTRALSSLFTAAGLKLRAPYFELRSLPKLPEVAPTSQSVTYASRPVLIRDEDDGPAQITVAYKGVALSNAKDLLALEIFAEVLGTGSVDAFHPASTANRAARLSRSLTSAHAFVDAYSDAGLFGVYAAADSALRTSGALWSAVQGELRATLDALSDDDVTRAQNRVRARLAAPAAASATALLAHGMTAAARAALVAQVSRADVQRVAAAVLASAPVLAARGDVSGVRL